MPQLDCSPHLPHCRPIPAASAFGLYFIPGLLFGLSLRSSNGQPLAFSFVDSVQAAQLSPLQLTALRASLCHRIYKYLQIRWYCPLTDKLARLPPLAPVPTLVTAAFRDRAAGAEWQRLACELDLLHSQSGGVAKVSDLMHEMARLLPFSSSAVVQRLLRLPMLNVDLATPGRFVYCLVSPLLGKVYVGAVGFRKPRSPYARLREHLKLVKLWASPASCRRYGCRAPGLYRAIGKVRISNVIQVILAEATAEKLAAECSFIRMMSPVFNVVGVSGHIA